MEAEIVVALYAEHCNKKGKPVIVSRDEELDLESPDYLVFRGTRQELAEHGLELTRLLDVFRAKCGHSLIAAADYDLKYVIRDAGTSLYVTTVDLDDIQEWSLTVDIKAADMYDTRADARLDAEPEDTIVERLIPRY